MKPVLILGAGGHGAVVVSALIAADIPIIGILDADETLLGTKVLGIDVLGDDRMIERWKAAEIDLANGVGCVDRTALRQALFERFNDRGFVFRPVVHPSAIIGPECRIDEGAQVMAGAIVQPRTRIGRNAIVNTGALIDHDCDIGDHVHVAPGATLLGGVTIGDGAMIGGGATIIPSIEIGAGAFVAAGATVTTDVVEKARVGGTPARAF